MATTGSPSLDNAILPMIARAYEVLRYTREAGRAVEGVVSLIVAARIIEADMREMLTRDLDPKLIAQAEEMARREIERIYTNGWARH